MSDRCAGCTNKYKFFEKPTLCPQCQRSFCNSCLPPPKKGRKSGAQIAQDTCVYCSRKQQQVKESEEKEILETFQERFYKHAHTEPPIQTRVQLDFSKQPKQSEKTAVTLTEEDKALIERHKKLKESRRAGEGSFDEDNVRDRLAKLRGESERSSEGQTSGEDAGTGSGGGGADTGGGGGEQGKGTQVEQASDLIEQMKDEVRIEGKLEEFNEVRDEELHQRFLALKGETAESSPSQLRKPKPPDMADIRNFLEDMEVQVVTDEDPESLLQDLRAFQSREEKLALSEAQSDDVMALVDKARELAREEGQPVPEDVGQNLTGGVSGKICYPPISDIGPGSVSASDESKGHSDDLRPEVTNLMRDVAEEVKQDEVRQKEDLEFTAGAAERLSKLRSQKAKNTAGEGDSQGSNLNFDDIAEDEEVRSKLPTKGSRKSLDFTWSHFGGSDWSHPDKPPSATPSGPSAARQLGLEVSGTYEEREEDISDEVHTLMKEVMAEAELDSKLERTGLGHYLDNVKKDDDSVAAKPAQPAVKPDSQGGASVGATAANYWSGAVGGRSYGFGDSDDLPWCCICNEDASIQCFDCDGDLYCTRCFSEGHEQFGMFDHKYGPFEPPRKAM